jgi:hypothetical protein
VEDLALALTLTWRVSEQISQSLGGVVVLIVVCSLVTAI